MICFSFSFHLIMSYTNKLLVFRYIHIVLLLQPFSFYFAEKMISDEKQVDGIEAFNSALRYLDDLSNIDNIYFGGMVN